MVISGLPVEAGSPLLTSQKTGGCLKGGAGWMIVNHGALLCEGFTRSVCHILAAVGG